MELITRILIVVIGIFGMLLMATNSFKRKPRKEFLFYFTNLSNLFVIIYYLLNINIVEVNFLVTLYITFTMIVFNFVILPYLKKNNYKIEDIGTDHITSNIVHIVIPLLSIFYWYNFSKDVSYSVIWLGNIFPLLYLVFAIMLGKSSYKIRDNITNYVYPFLDLDKLGRNKVIINCLFLFIFLMLTSFALIFFK